MVQRGELAVYIVIVLVLLYFVLLHFGDIDKRWCKSKPFAKCGAQGKPTVNHPQAPIQPLTQKITSWGQPSEREDTEFMANTPILF